MLGSGPDKCAPCHYLQQRPLCSEAGLGKVWEVATGRALINLSEHLGEVKGVNWSAGGERAGTAAADRRMRLWDVRGVDDDEG